MEGPSHFPNEEPENSEYPNSPESDPQESSENDSPESDSEKSSENDSSEENFVDSSDGEMDPDAGFSAESSDSEEEEPELEPTAEDLPRRREPIDTILYPGSTITLLQAVVLVLQFFFKHNCTKRLLNDLLKLLTRLLPTGHKLPSSKYRLFNFVKKTTGHHPTVRKHYVCIKKNCMRYVHFFFFFFRSLVFALWFFERKGEFCTGKQRVKTLKLVIK